MAIPQLQQPAATAVDSPAPAVTHPAPEVVGNAFVHQYYNVLQQSPELVFRFYLDRSKLGRSDGEGLMTFVTTLEEINRKIMQQDYIHSKVEINTVDSQESLGGGVMVLVTGCFAKEIGGKRNFTQTFFLAPQDKGYFVLNDLFRYLEEAGGEQGREVVNDDLPLVLDISELQQNQPSAQQVQQEDEEEPVEEVCNPLENEKESFVDEETSVNQVVVEVLNCTDGVPEPSVSMVTKEVPKKSYASIVKVMKENVASLSVHVPIAAKPAPLAPERPVIPSQPLSVAPEVPPSNPNPTDGSNVQEMEANGCSVYIKNLPLNAIPSQLEEEFKKFGPIKSDGIQVRSNKLQGFCFGFVEFEVASAAQSAIGASPVMIGGRQAYVEEKRASASRVGTRGRITQVRGGYRNDGARGRGSYGGGRGYPRSDFGNRGGGRGGPANRGDGGYQRADYEYNSRPNHPGGLDINASKNVAPRVSASA